MYPEYTQTWASRNKAEKRAERKEIVGNILFIIFIGISFWIALFI